MASDMGCDLPWLSASWIDIWTSQNDRGTIWIAPGGFPPLTGAEAERLYDINKLEEIHR
jgi:hypothetical protein